jgi:hypothetical protein
VSSALVAAGVRSDQLAASGTGAPAQDLLLGSGRVRGISARQEAARSALAARSSQLAATMTGGRYGPDHLDALVRRLRPIDDDHLNRIAFGTLLVDGHELPADTFDRSLRRAVETAAIAAEADDEPTTNPDDKQTPPPTGQPQASNLRHWFDQRSGMGFILAELDAERYEAAAGAIDHHTKVLAHRYQGTVELGSELAAEAMVNLICSSGERRTYLPHVTVIVDQQTLATGLHHGTVSETGDGRDLSPQAIERLCCDSVLQKVTLDPHGQPINVGRRHRTATPSQRTALAALYRSCGWDGCDRPLSHCQIHHIKHWNKGGSTDLDNLIPLCSHHHHLVHEGGWTIELLPSRAVRITRPDGVHHATAPPPSRRPSMRCQPSPLDTQRSLTTE